MGAASMTEAEVDNSLIKPIWLNWLQRGRLDGRGGGAACWSSSRPTSCFNGGASMTEAGPPR